VSSKTAVRVRARSQLRAHPSHHHITPLSFHTKTLTSLKRLDYLPHAVPSHRVVAIASSVTWRRALTDGSCGTVRGGGGRRKHNEATDARAGQPQPDTNLGPRQVYFCETNFSLALAT